MADHHCPACGASSPRGAGFCPACGTALDAPSLPFDSMASQGLATETEVALGAGRSNPKRSALIVGIVAVVVIGGGLVVGSGSGDDDGNAESPPATTVAPVATTAASPRTTVERTTTTTAMPSFAGPPIPELAGQRLYGIVEDRVVRIDPATGEVTVLGEGSRSAEDWSWLIPRAGGVVLVGDSALYFADDGSPVVRLGPGGGSVWPANDPARLWVQSFPSAGPLDGGSTAELVELATGETVATIDIPQYAYPLGDDGAGGVLVQTEGGGLYAINAAGAATRLSDGTFRSASPTHLVLFRCDEHLVCGYEVVSRATGEAVPVEVPNAQQYPLLVPDPTGARMAVVSGDGMGALNVVELATGNVTTIAESGLVYGSGSPVTWTADGQHLAWARGSDFSVLTMGNDEPVTYSVRVEDAQDARMTAFAVGP